MEKFERKIGFVDILMISLALVSLGLLIYEDVADPGPEQKLWIIYIDLGIVAIFAIEFIARISQAKDKKAYLKSHWYDLIGMVPVAHPLFRGFRLARLVRIVAIGSRFLRAADRSLGEAVVHRQLEKYKGMVVQELTAPIIMTAFGITEQAVLKGNYGSAVARGLEENRAHIVERVISKMRDDRALALVLKMPGIGSGIERLPGRVLDGVIDTLADPGMDETIRDVLREIFSGLRADFSERTWRSGSLSGGAGAVATSP